MTDLKAMKGHLSAEWAKPKKENVGKIGAKTCNGMDVSLVLTRDYAKIGRLHADINTAKAAMVKPVAKISAEQNKLNHDKRNAKKANCAFLAEYRRKKVGR